MGHSCRGLLPRVEELEPKNVPLHPLKREVQKERQGRWPPMGPVLHL